MAKTLEELLTENDKLLNQDSSIQSDQLEQPTQSVLTLTVEKTPTKDNRKIRDGLLNLINKLQNKIDKDTEDFKPKFTGKIPLISGLIFLISCYNGAVRFNTHQEALKKYEENKYLTEQETIKIRKYFRIELEKIVNQSLTKTIRIKEEYLVQFYEELDNFPSLRLIQDESDKLKFTLFVI